MRHLFAVVAAVVGALTFAQSAAAQAPYVQVVTLEVRPGTAQAYADYLMEVNEAAEMIGDPRTVAVYRPVAGGSPFRFQLVTPFNERGDMDDWMGPPTAILAAAHGEDEAREIREVVEDIVVSVDVQISTFQPQFSGSPDAPNLGQGYIRIVTTSVEPDGNDDYANMLRATAAIETQRGIKRSRWTVSEGESFTHVATNFADTIGQVAVPGQSPRAILTDALGEEVGGAIVDRANAGVRSRTFETWRYHPELSRGQ